MKGTLAQVAALAVRLPNWVGDVCMCLPSLFALHEAGFDLRCFGRAWAPGLLGACPWTTEPVASGSIAAGRQLRASGCRRGICFTNSFSSALAMRLAGIEALGYRGDWRRLLLAAAIPSRRGVHEVERFWDLALAAGWRWRPEQGLPTEPPATLLPLPASAVAEADRILTRHGLAAPFVVLCPLATGRIHGRPKIWPHWRALCQLLAERGLRLATCPGPGEEESCRLACPEAVCLVGLDLVRCAALMSRSRLIVANDSGPMHLASAAGAPVLGIFGVSPPARTHPWGGAWVGAADQWPEPAAVLAWIDRLLAPAASD